jgi:hypothetical protein
MTGGIGYWKQRLRRTRLQRASAGIDIDGHDMVVVREVKELFAVASPPRLVATPRRHMPFPTCGPRSKQTALGDRGVHERYM